MEDYKVNKIKYLIVSALLAILMPVQVFAVGNITPSLINLTVTKGETATFTITATNAAGRVDISSADESIVTIDKTSEWLENDNVVITVTGISKGATTIDIELVDVATFDEEELIGNYIVSVTVTNPEDDNPSDDDEPQDSDEADEPDGTDETDPEVPNTSGDSSDNKTQETDNAGFAAPNTGIFGGGHGGTVVGISLSVVILMAFGIYLYRRQSGIKFTKK